MEPLEHTPTSSEPRDVNLPHAEGDDAGEAVTCVWCDSTQVEQIRDFGSLLMTSQWFCNSCNSPFERIRHRGRGSSADA